MPPNSCQRVLTSPNTSTGNIMGYFRNILAIIVLMLLAEFAFAAAGYRISIRGELEGSYVLHGWHWGEKYSVDTVSASDGKVVFKGKSDLECGTYAISGMDGKQLVEFIVPMENKKFRCDFELSGRKISIKKGNGENSLFVDFQNLINWEWEQLSGKDDFLAKVGAMQKTASAEYGGTLVDIILRNNLFAPETAMQMRENFPFGNPIIANTHFARAKVVQYLELLQNERYNDIGKEVNSLIGSIQEKDLQSRIAHTAYGFFYNSKIMGHEGIAVEIAQEWFLNDKLVWPNEEGKFMLRTFVEFNKNSLLGMEAPELNLTDTSGNAVSLHSIDSEYTIVYFYTDECRSCMHETPKLVDFVNEYDKGVISVYAVYSDGNRDKWIKYIDDNLYIYNPFATWVNVYDPDYSSGFQMLYNVIKTPQMFLLDKEMKIIGRGLSVDALKKLLEKEITDRDNGRALIEGLFVPLAGDTATIRGAINALYEKNKDDIAGCKAFLWEAYATFGRSGIYSLQEDAVWLAEKYILGKPELWSNRIREKVSEETRRFNMNRLGEKAAEITREMADGSSIGLSDVTTKYKVLYFYRPNCGMCSAVTPKMAQLYNRFKGKLDIEFIAINLGGSFGEWIGYIQKTGAEWIDARGTDGDSSPIYKKYWLQNIPAIYLLENGIVVAKDINDIDLEEILNTITK